MDIFKELPTSTPNGVEKKLDFSATFGILLIIKVLIIINMGQD